MYVDKFPAVFRLPDSKESVWRYMSLDKFVSLLQRRALFFCRSDRFEDRFEGSYPRGASIEDALAQMDVTFIGDPDLPKRRELAEQMLRSRRQSREAFLVSCWHINEHESTAMWKLYAQSNNGIAIKSTVGKLKDSIQCPEDVLLGAVEYLDYDNTAAFASMNI